MPAPLLFILVTLLLDAIGVGIVFPMLPDLMARVGIEGTANGSVRGGILMSAYALMLFLCGPAMGALSDRFGRRPVILIALAALTFDYVLMAVAQSFWLLLLGRVLAGIAGSTYSAATAYLADISSPEERAARFGLIGAAFGIGFVVGPVIGGMAAQVHVALPFWLAAGATGAACLIGLVMLPESLAPEKRRQIRPKDLNPFAAILQVSRLPGLAVPLLITFVFEFANLVYPTLWAFWLRELFGWSAGAIGLSLGVYGVGISLTQGVVMGPMIRRLGEYRTLVFALVCSVVAFVGFGLLATPWLMFAFLVPACLSDMAPPTLQAVAANRTDDTMQGVLQGVIMSLASIAAAIAPLIATGVFRVFAAPDAPVYFPGAPFLLSALMVAPLVFLVRRLR